MTRSFVRTFCMLAALACFFAPTNALAYQHWSDDTDDVGQCAGCHGAFRSGTYTSQAEGISWGDTLHKVHLNNTDVGSSCSNCHNGTGVTGNQVRINSSGVAIDGVNAIGCMGCHGRLEDANEVTFFGEGWGAGLRQHHFSSSNAEAAAACGGCHADSNPENFTTAPENTMPPFYSFVTNTSINMTMDPCSADGEEDFSSNGTGLDNDGDFAYDGVDSDCSAIVPTGGDINLDGKADILWRNTSTGQNWAYLMNGASIDSSSSINTVSVQAWQIVGNGDYDGDGDADVLWRNSSTGQNWMYLMQDGAIDSSASVNTVADQAWQIVGNGDYDGDGDADVLWRNSSTGQNWMYLMTGASIDSSVAVNTIQTTWQVVGNGDYNGDDKADILWRNSGTGQVWMYLMNGATIDSSVSVTTVASQAWQVVGNGDYDGDGDADILWRNSSSGQNWMYLMNGATISSSLSVNTVPNPTNWKVAGDGDYNGDGKADILWRNISSGQNWMYLMNGSTIDSSVSVNTVAGTAWQIINVN